MLALAAGVTSPIKADVFGELYLAEVFLPLLVLALLVLDGGWQRLLDRSFLAMLVAFYCMLIGYVVSDVVVGSRPDQYVRGWGRVLLTISDFVAYYFLFAWDRRLLWWLVLGMGLGGLGYLQISGEPLSQWKLGYAEPAMLVALATSCALPGRLKGLPMLGFGLQNFSLDYRSLGTICLAIGAYASVVGGRGRSFALPRASALKLLAAGVLVLMATSWLLSVTAEEDVASRRAQSNAGRQAAIEVAMFAVADSPFIGHGSWTENQELVRMMRKLTKEHLGHDLRGASTHGKVFTAHSQFLCAWVEGGLLAVSFFFYLIFRLVFTGRWILLDRPADFLSPMLLYFLFATAWNSFMSPFAGSHRLSIGIGAAMLVVAEIDRRRLESGRRNLAVAKIRREAFKRADGSVMAARKLKFAPRQSGSRL